MPATFASRPIDGGRHEVVLGGRLYAASAADLRATLDDAASRARVVLVDATALEAADGNALGELLGAVRRIRARGGVLVAFGLQPLVRELLEATGIARLLSVVGTRDEALREVA